ncbi:MAG: GGDEF domain-containing protein [Gammaproteobacteria bacterium]|nr:GGDEF domain-containing protein [Gammaproteobacteria bacterium]MDH5694834.1 GGDEF domain-containing protein [Gammaproteobacteria bacterium]
MSRKLTNLYIIAIVLFLSVEASAQVADAGNTPTWSFWLIGTLLGLSATSLYFNLRLKQRLNNKTKELKDRLEQSETVSHKLQYLARHDGLTGLVNRRVFSDLLSQEVLRGERYNSLFALMVLNLNGFKPINDKFGLGVADQTLQEVATRLHATLRESDILARIDGDEFAFLAIEVKDENALHLMCQRILATFTQPIKIEAHEIYLTARMGVVLFPNHGTDGNELLLNADLAMNKAKRTQKGYCIYQTETISKAV